MAPTPVYDDEKEKAQGHHDDLGIHPERREAEIDDLENMYNAPAAGEGGQHKAPNAAELARREAEGYGPGALPRRDGSLPQRKEKKAVDDSTGGGLYRHEGSPGDDKKSAILFGGGGFIKSKLNKMAGDKKSGKAKVLLGVGLGGSGLFLIIGILIVLFATLKIPNLSEHILSWQAARVGRTFRQGLSQINAEKIAVDAADDTKYNAIKAKYTGVRSATWGKLDKWRPGRTYKNLNATGRLDYKYSDPNIIGRQRLEKIIIDGVEIDPADQRLLRRIAHPLQAREDRIRLAAEIDANLDKSLQGQRSLVRGSVAKRIRADLDIKLYRWEKFGRDYRQLKKDAADRLAAREAEERVNQDPDEPSKSKPIQDAEDAARDAQDQCLTDDDCLDEIIREAGDPESPGSTLAGGVDDAITSSLDSPLLKTLEVGSTVFGIAMPICIIYEGSVENSAGSVDAASGSLQRSYYLVSSAADQQKSGDTTADAVGAENRRLGDISTSIPEQRAKYGKAISTADVQGPQAAAAGHYSLLDALFGSNPATSAANSVASSVCPDLTDWKTGLGLLAAEAAIAIIPGFGQATKAGGGATKVAVGEIMKGVTQNLLSKRALRRMLGEAAGTAGLTVLAKMIVLSRMNAQFNGLSRGQAAANEADMGGNLHWNEIDRQQFYGRTLTEPEVVASNISDQGYIAQQKAQQGFYKRYLALSNPDSLLVNMGVSTSGKLTNKHTLSGVVASTTNRLNSSLFSSGIFAAVNPFKRQQAFAQEKMAVPNSDYRIIQWGWSEDELALIDSDPEYFPLRNDEILEASGRKSDIESKYGKCFTTSVGELLADKQIQRDEDGRTHARGGDCAPENLGRNNPEGFGDLVLRWRLAKRNEAVIDHLLEIENPQEDNAPVAPAGGSGVTGDIGENSDSVQCPAGTNDKGVVESLYSGPLRKDQNAPFMIRLCQIPDIPGYGNDTSGNQVDGGIIVNARAAGAWQALAKAAQTEGVGLHATSSFRLAHSCGGTGDGNLCAKPGQSNHQLGIAVDFASDIMGSSSVPGAFTSAGAACDGDGRARFNSPQWNWLVANASKFGVGQLSHEAWHWEAGPEDARRCYN